MQLQNTIEDKKNTVRQLEPSKNKVGMKTFPIIYNIHREAARLRGETGSITEVGEVLVSTMREEYTVEHVEDDLDWPTVFARHNDSGERFWIRRDQTYSKSKTWESLGIKTPHPELKAHNLSVTPRLEKDPSKKTAKEIFSFLRNFIEETGVEGERVAEMLSNMDGYVHSAIHRDRNIKNRPHKGVGGMIIRVDSTTTRRARTKTFLLPEDSDSWSRIRLGKWFRNEVYSDAIYRRSDQETQLTLSIAISSILGYPGVNYHLIKNHVHYDDFTEVEIAAIPSHREQLEKSFTDNIGPAVVADGWL